MSQNKNINMVQNKKYITWLALTITGHAPRLKPFWLRCQTAASIWTLGGDQPVIPRVAFIR
jgi:hypothetical protein